MKKSLRRINITLLALLFIFGAGRQAAATTFNFSNTAPITINDNASATPYPSNITLGSFGAFDVNVIVRGLSHGFPNDIGILLVGPGGQKVVLMNNTGGVNPITVH